MCSVLIDWTRRAKRPNDVRLPSSWTVEVVIKSKTYRVLIEEGLIRYPSFFSRTVGMRFTESSTRL